VAIRRVHFNDRPFDLAVIEVDARVLERVPHAFLKVVPVATTSIGRKQIELSFEQA